MLSNLTSQLKEQNAEDKILRCSEEVPRVRKDLGEPPLVTLSSRSLVQAVFNVLMGKKDIKWLQRDKKLFSGEYGKTVKPISRFRRNVSVTNSRSPAVPQI